MNELDLDKLLSMEESIPAAKPQPEQKPEPPATTPPDPAPEETPAEMPKLTKPQLVSLTVLTALILAIGFFAGYLFRSAPTPEQTTAPPVTTAPPISTVPPSTAPALAATEIYKDAIAVCYAYSDRVQTVVEREQFCFYDGNNRYLFASQTQNLNRADPGYHNIWIRVELTQKGKEQFAKGAKLQIVRNAVSDPDWSEIYLGATPYYADDDSTLGGWLIHGWIPQQSSVYFQIIYSENNRHQLYSVPLSPIVCDSNLVYYSTQMLAHLVLNDRAFWKNHSDGLPEDFAGHSALQALSQRESSISVLMEYLLTGSSSEQKRAISVLKHKAFLDMMSGVDRKAFYAMIDDYFTVTIYDQALTQVQVPPPAGQNKKTTYLLDSEATYRLGSPIPEPADGEKPINFFARLELSDYYRTLYHDGWQLLVDWQFTPGGLSTWQYFNAEGQVAGWFVFGHLSGDTTLEFQLINTSSTNIPIYTKSRSVSPRSKLIVAESDDSSGSPDNSYWLQQDIVFQDNTLIGHTYREAPLLTTVTDVPGVLLQDGPILYHLWEIPEEIAYLNPSEYNVWIRVELTEEGKKRYTEPHMLWLDNYPYITPFPDSLKLGIVPYDTGGGTLEGWFILGCATQIHSIPVVRQGLNIHNPIQVPLTAEPLWPADESVLLTTDLLVDQILTNDSMWNTISDKISGDLIVRPQLYALSRRKDGVNKLLEYYVHSPATVWSRIDLILQHPSFARQMTPEQQALWAQRDQPRFSVEPLSQRLTEYTDGSDHYFTDGTTSWRISEAVPEAVKYIDPHEFNCYAQLTLSDFCRQVGYDGWFLRVRADGFITTLAAREYYDDSGALAGWFVYGKLSGETEVTFWLENENAKTVESISQPLSPLA